MERYCGMADCAVHFASLVFVFFVITHEEKAEDERPSRVRDLLGSLC